MRGFFIFSLFNILNKILSFLRISVQASLFGDGTLNDSFCIANRTLALFRRVAVDGNLETMIVTYYKTSSNRRQFAGKIVFLVLIVLVVLGVILSFISPVLAIIYSLRPEIVPYYVDFISYLWPVIPLMFLISIFTGILNSNKEFKSSAPATFLGNIFNITALMIVAKYKGLFWSLVIGSLLYSLVPVLFMLPTVSKYLEIPKNIAVEEEEKEFFLKSIQSTLWQNLISFSDHYTHNQAAKLAVGSMSAFEYGHKIIHFIYSIIATSLSSAFSIKIAGETGESLTEKTTTGFVISHILATAPCLFVIFYGDVIAQNVFGSMQKISNIKLISDNIVICGVSLYFYIQNRLLNTAILSQKQLQINIISGLIFAVVNFLCSYFYCESILQLSWGCNAAVIAQFIFLIGANIYKGYLKLSLHNWLYIFLSTISSYFMVIGVKMIYELQTAKYLLAPIVNYYPIFKPLATSLDILVPFFLLYLLHILMNYSYTKSLFSK